ncbi:MAG: hypothetical protein IJ723_07005 [Ruminococcus sp.]|nr:hypothetical protein [Ruminococcus sp.]
MDMITITVFCLAVCLALKLVGSVNGEIKLMCTVLAVCLIAARYFEGFKNIYTAVSGLFSQTGLDIDYLRIIVKSLGICFTTQIGCDCCRDCGENALASQLELAGKAAMILTAVPLFDNAADIVSSLMQV